MDQAIRVSKKNPKEYASIFSKLTFAWMVKLFYRGQKQGLQVADLYKHNKCDSSELVAEQLTKNWNNELARAKLQNVKPSLRRAIFITFFWSYMGSGVLFFITFACLRTLQPVILSYFIAQFTPFDKRLLEKYVSGSVLVFSALLVVFLTHHSSYSATVVGMRVRTAVSSLIYRKLMVLSQKALGQTATGQIVNLLSNDVNRFDDASLSLHFLWLGPFQLVLASYFLWMEVGISSLSGILSILILTFPLQAYMGTLSSYFRLKVAERTDYRIRLMNEIVSSIQVIKMYAWEKPFSKIVNLARKNELKYLTKTSYLRGIYLSCMVFIERATLYLTVITYVLLGFEITASKVFSMAQFFNLLQMILAIYYPLAISVGAEMLVSIDRLQSFLVLDEKQESTIEKDLSGSLELKQVHAEWVENVPTLINIELNVNPGTMCAIVGPVGAGKSSLLQLLLGELVIKSGKVLVGGSISYSSQQPWLFSSSVRENILFGLEYKRSHYRKVVKVCALEKDFEQFPQGDKTVVGERGVSLSGGQRARINLARAVYREADIYLLDDPLSAVDTHVGKQLFEECILKYLKHKTRVLVTHQLQYLKQADNIVVLNNGIIEAQGTFSELSNSDVDFTKMLLAADETEEKQKLPRRVSVHSRSASIKSVESELMELEKNDEKYDGTNKSFIKTYFRAGANWFNLTLLISIFLISQIACTAADLWVTIWTEAVAQDRAVKNQTSPDKYVELHESLSNNSKNVQSSFYTYVVDVPTTFSVPERNYYIYVYSGIIIMVIITTLIRSIAFYKVAMLASKKLHSKMFRMILQATMRFFDTNPSGRILNRFTKDIGAIDELLPRTMLQSIQVMLVMVGILVNVSYANYYMVIVIVILAVVFTKLRNVYLRTAVHIKHLEGITKSPVFSHINSSLNGITTIRATQKENTLIMQFDSHQDVHTSAWSLTLACISAFGLWLDVLAVLFIAIVTYSFILIDINGSLVGLALSQSLILTGMLQMGMRQSAEAVNHLTSVERIMQYTKLEKEGPYETPGDVPLPAKWPQDGWIKFIHLYMHYSPLDSPVLKNLNFEILPHEKIGIVGRTGAGKSSLITALFRLAPLEGRILIDDIDIKIVGLTDLRKRISIIPQEPVLFSATLRYNLDPFKEYDDDKIWSALEEVELKDAVPSLDFLVTEGGGNFSLGQRQLICLARAIVRNNKILILDEATANVDPKTDSLIQQAIRKKFVSSTVVTIAHRLNTIMDSDKVLVMDRGVAIQFDHPHVLLQNPDGHFYKMVEQTGSSMARQLHEVASRAYIDRFEYTHL